MFVWLELRAYSFGQSIHENHSLKHKWASGSAEYECEWAGKRMSEWMHSERYARPFSWTYLFYFSFLVSRLFLILSLKNAYKVEVFNMNNDPTWSIATHMLRAIYKLDERHRKCLRRSTGQGGMKAFTKSTSTHPAINRNTATTPANIADQPFGRALRTVLFFMLCAMLCQAVCSYFVVVGFYFLLLHKNDLFHWIRLNGCMT